MDGHGISGDIVGVLLVKMSGSGAKLAQRAGGWCWWGISRGIVTGD